jgi:hypothetical protein
MATLAWGGVKMRAGLIRSVCRSLFALFLTFSAGSELAAQATARVRAAEENFRREPNGTPVATVLRGAEFPLLAEQGGWAQVELQGWVWAPSLAATTREGFNLRVAATAGENLRVSPQGDVRARLLEGCLLDRVGSSGNWVQVRRTGWLWKASLEISGSAAAAAADASAPPSLAGGEPDPRPPPVITATTPLVVYATPDGDTVATFESGAQAQVLGRTGDWVRIRVDGWVYGPAALDSALTFDDTGDLSPAQLRADPARYRGALVRWRVQFISLRSAERTRTDFAEGEPFIHARGPAGDAGFVYLAVPEELLSVAEALQPLDYVTVVGRVRTGRSSMLGSPVIDLTDIETEESQD